MPRLRIFAKGNADVRDSLVALFEDGTAQWNGINAALRGCGVTARAHVAHELGLRSDLLLTETPHRPARDVPLGRWTAAVQGETRLFAGGHDVVVLSIQPDVMNRIARHRASGALFYPHDADRWPAADRAWLAGEYAPAPPLTPDASMTNLAAIVARLRRADPAPAILVYNLSPVLGWERIHCYRGLEETLGERIRRFNLALAGLSRATGISIVDVDAVVAREGAIAAKQDMVTLTAAGCRAVAAEVAHILGDLGLLPPAGGA